MKLIRALLGATAALAVAASVQVATAPSTSAQSTTQCLNCWSVVQR